MKNNKTETYKEKVEHLCKVTGFEKDRCKEFVTFVWQYLDSCGYFLCDFNIHNIKRPDDWINYSDRDFGKWLLDMALQYNMEQGKEYKCELVENRNEK